jgi:hypothetical protein
VGQPKRWCRDITHTISYRRLVVAFVKIASVQFHFGR